MFRFSFLPLSLIAVCFLVACGGGGGNSSSSSGSGSSSGGSSSGGSSSAFTCSPVGGGSAQVSSSCISCSSTAVTNPRLAIDTDLSSAAGVTLFNSPTPTQGQVSLRGTAQSGIVFPAGSKAGLVFGLPTAPSVQYSATVNTYLSGTQQESKNVVMGNTGATNGQIQYFGFTAASPTTKQFDAVEISITELNPNTERHDFRVFEFCSDGAAK